MSWPVAHIGSIAHSSYVQRSTLKKVKYFECTKVLDPKLHKALQGTALPQD